MGSIIHNISTLSAAQYGVNILEVAPPSSVKSAVSSVVGMVADLPWGETNAVTLITGAAEFFSAFYPDVFDAATKDTATYPALRALLRKRLTAGGLKVVRIDATGATAATSGSITAGTGTVTIPAKHKSALGNQIAYWFTAATGGDANKRDLTISIGSAYSVAYTDLDLAALIAIDDPYLGTITDTSATAMPSITPGPTLFSGGSDGTAAAGDYVGSSSSDVGVRKFYGASVDVNVLFVAECPSGLVDTVNAGLVAWGQDTDKGIPVLCTAHGQAAADALTYVADNSLSDDRPFCCWPRIKARDLFLADQAVTVMDGNAFAAFAIANQEPWLSPGGAGKKQGSTDLLAGIVGLEDESATMTMLNLLNAAGVCPWFIDRDLGIILHRAVVTDGSRLFARRAKDWINSSFAGFAVGFAETQLDLNFSEQDLGPNTGGLIDGWKTWLETQKGLRRIQEYTVDPFSANSQSNLDVGQWQIINKIKLYAMIEELISLAQIGETVQFHD